MSPEAGNGQRHVIVVGGGFAGVGCVKRLAGEDGVRVTLIDRHNYHQFQPLLYQVATSQLASSDIAFSLRKLFRNDANVSVKLGEVTELDPATRTVTLADGERFTGDALVLAAGSQPNFFRTPCAAEHALPLYSLDDATRLRSRILEAFEAADRDPSRIDDGALTFVVVGGGPTGVELAGALADLIAETMTVEYHDLAVTSAQIHLVDLGHTLLGPFSDSAHDYAAKVLGRKGVRLHLGVAVTEVGAGHVSLADGTTLRTRCVVWGGGIKAPPVAASGELPRGRGGRIDVLPDLTIAGADGVYVVGDIANIPSPDGHTHPQLGSVALQSGVWAAENILADAAGGPRKSFHYHDKGIMAMIGRNAAVAEVGKRHHQVEGPVAFAAWLGVHATLLSGVHSKTDAFLSWAWDYFDRDHSATVEASSAPQRLAWREEDEDLPHIVLDASAT